MPGGRSATTCKLPCCAVKRPPSIRHGNLPIISLRIFFKRSCPSLEGQPYGIASQLATIPQTNRRVSPGSCEPEQLVGQESVLRQSFPPVLKRDVCYGAESEGHSRNRWSLD